MSDILNEAQALVQCRTCSWYKNCAQPIRVTENDLKKQIESSIGAASNTGIPFGVSELLSSMAMAAQNSLLEGCPVFIERLRSSPKLAEQVKKLMKDWSQVSDEKM